MIDEPTWIFIMVAVVMAIALALLWFGDDE